MIHVRALSLVACLLGIIGFAGSAAAQAEIVGQPPCAGSDDYCVSFRGGATIPIIRTFNYTAPSKGTAAVTFNGSLLCSNEVASDRVVDLVSQVMTGDGAPQLGKPGSLRLAIVLKDAPEHRLYTSDTVNLATTRVFHVPAAGVQRYRFKMAAIRMDGNTICYVYNAAFVVQFVP